MTQSLENTSVKEIEKVTYEQYVSEQRESEAIKLRYEIVECDYSLKYLLPNELKNCLVEAGFTGIHFYKKRRLGNFHPEESGFSVVARK